MIRAALAIAGALLAGGRPAESQLPAIADDMLDQSASVCIMIADDGHVRGAVLIQSSGDRLVDEHMLGYARLLRWNAAGPGATDRNRWMPMGLAFGKARPPKTPNTCGPLA